MPATFEAVLYPKPPPSARSLWVLLGLAIPVG